MDTENADFDNTSRRSRVPDEEPFDLNSKIKELYLYLLLNDRQKSVSINCFDYFGWLLKTVCGNFLGPSKTPFLYT